MVALEAIEGADGFCAKLYQDEDPMNPRKDDALGIMVHWHRNYDLGDREATEIELDALSRGGWKLLERYLRMTEKGFNVIPIGLLDHSGLHVYAKGGSHWSDSAGWDSGTVGFIYTTLEKIVEFGVSPDNVDQQLLAEIETYDQYLRGDVYGYVVEDAEGTDHDSCWGFYGWGYALEEAKAALESSVSYEHKQVQQIERMMAV